MMPSDFLSRGIDYLGDLGAKLRDLQGFRTLTHELVQNADDAPTAQFLSFDVGEQSLVVDNDGYFSECPDVRTDECAWKEDGIHNHRCDFHRFRRIASGDKRGQEGTTGAFGIGFIAVYQVTDTPELISAKRHWILHEERPEDQRIEICRGCDKCRQDDLPATRFILPWARDPESSLRLALRAEAVSSDGPDRFCADLQSALPTAMLFLKRLRKVRVSRNGKHIQELERADVGASLILSQDGAPDRIWHVIEGDFRSEATRLRAAYPGKIESKRSSVIKLAIPAEGLSSGLLCACLPTEQDLGLPFHLNADFYPSNDRKRIILSDDYQSLWNREAIKAAAIALGSYLGQLPQLIGATQFWAMMEQISDLALKVEQGRSESVLASFWAFCAPVLRTDPVIPTSRKGWASVSDARLLLQKEETAAIDVLEALDLQIVHEDLRPFQNLLRSKSVGVALVDIRRVSEALAKQGLHARQEISQLPEALKPNDRRKALWQEIGMLLDRPQREELRTEDERRLRQIALAPGRDGALWPCGIVFAADDETIVLFEGLDSDLPFLAENSDFPSRLASLCPRFEVGTAINLLAQIGAESLEDRWNAGKLPVADVVGWFENRRQQILASPSLKSALANLPIFPSAGRLRPLTELALSGNFDDPLGVADLVDLSVLGDRRGFLRDLDTRELDFPTYAAFTLPRVLGDVELPDEKRRAAVLLLAARLGEVKDIAATRHILISCRIVECRDDIFRAAPSCYFDNVAVRDCLDSSAHFVVLPRSHESAVRDLYDWLGVASEPRLEDVLGKIREMAAGAYSPTVVQVLQRIVGHLSRRIEGKEEFDTLAPLQRLRWLPARGKVDRWYAPSELHADYQSYLFESQALILDLPNRIQTSGRTLLEFLGVHLTPATILVVKHLLSQASLGVAINAEVYRFLNDKYDDPALSQLCGKACLWLDDAYRRPDQAFWGEHPFGPYRWRLGDQLRSYAKLLTALNVRETPSISDFLKVLQEVSADFSASSRMLDEDSYAVLMECWRAIGRALRDQTIASAEIEALRSTMCVPDKTRVLNRPEWMFFENRAGLADKFGTFLNRSVIPRPVDTGDALAVAGVRPLGIAVVTDLLECRNLAADQNLQTHILSRRNEIARVLDALGGKGGTREALERFVEIQCHVADSIEIRYRLHAFNRELHSKPEQVPALYQSSTDGLIYALRDQIIPWASIARELAIALYPDEDPGRFAAGLKEALAPGTAQEAAAVLDELGFARLDTTVTPPVATGKTAAGLGTEAPVGGNPDDTDRRAQQTADDMSTEEAEAPPTQPEGDSEPTGNGAGGGRSGTSGETGGGGQPGSGRRTHTGKRAAGSRGGRPFISYVGVDSNEEEPDPDGLDALKRQALEEEAIRLILTREPQLRRTPRHNPGYDLYEPDDKGQPRLWVEVKAMTGGLRDRRVGMSHTQFEWAQENAEDFWLYVVEQTGTPAARIVRIQDPAGKARTFTFDEGWLAVAQIDDREEPE